MFLYFLKFNDPIDTRRKFNVHKIFIRCLGRLAHLLNVLWTFNLCHVSTGKGQFLASKVFILCKKAVAQRAGGHEF